MNGRKNFHINLKNQPNEPVGERVVSERGRKELPPSTRGGENLKPNRYYEHKQHAFDSYCKKVLKCEACNGYRQISRHQKRFAFCWYGYYFLSQVSLWNSNRFSRSEVFVHLPGGFDPRKTFSVFTRKTPNFHRGYLSRSL